MGEKKRRSWRRITCNYTKLKSPLFSFGKATRPLQTNCRHFINASEHIAKSPRKPIRPTTANGWMMDRARSFLVYCEKSNGFLAFGFRCGIYELKGKVLRLSNKHQFAENIGWRGEEKHGDVIDVNLYHHIDNKTNENVGITINEEITSSRRTCRHLCRFLSQIDDLLLLLLGSVFINRKFGDEEISHLFVRLVHCLLARIQQKNPNGQWCDALSTEKNTNWWKLNVGLQVEEPWNGLIRFACGGN